MYASDATPISIDVQFIHSAPVEMYELRRMLFSHQQEVAVYVAVHSNCEIWCNAMIHAVGAGLYGVALLTEEPLVRERLWQNVRIILRQMEADGWRVFSMEVNNKICAFLSKGNSHHANWQMAEDCESWRQKGMDAIDAWLMTLPVPEAKLTYPSERRLKKSNQCSS
jgi:hypothetical protein